MLAHLGVTSLKKNDSNILTHLSTWTLVSSTNGEGLESVAFFCYM